MNPGILRHKITLQRLNKIQDTYGEEKEEWVDICTVWAAVEPLAGKQFFAAEAVNSEITHKIRLRYRQGISADMRVMFGTRIFIFSSPPINYQERNVELQLMCRELL